MNKSCPYGWAEVVATLQPFDLKNLNVRKKESPLFRYSRNLGARLCLAS